jgi:hypothetical protein
MRLKRRAFRTAGPIGIDHQFLPTLRRVGCRTPRRRSAPPFPPRLRGAKGGGGQRNPHTPARFTPTLELPSRCAAELPPVRFTAYG